MTTIRKRLTFHAAHLLTGDEGKCGNLHGHTYTVELTLAGEAADGMVADFREIKTAALSLIERDFDHAFLYHRGGALECELAAVLERAGKHTLPLPGRITAENLARWLYERLSPQLKQLTAVTVWETADNSAEYRP